MMVTVCIVKCIQMSQSARTVTQLGAVTWGRCLTSRAVTNYTAVTWEDFSVFVFNTVLVESMFPLTLNWLVYKIC